MKNLVLNEKQISVLKQSIITYKNVLESFPSECRPEAEISLLADLYAEMEE